jgi:hypothetical protein
VSPRLAPEDEVEVKVKVEAKVEAEVYCPAPSLVLAGNSLKRSTFCFVI